MQHNATPLKRAAFLAAYQETGTIRAAAEAAGIDRTTHYRWLDDPEYAELFYQAQQEAVESLEAEARRRAVTGWQEPIFYQGQVVGHRRRYSDTLLIFLLKGAMPDKYVDKVQQMDRVSSSAPLGVNFVDNYYGAPKGVAELTYYKQEQDSA